MEIYVLLGQLVGAIIAIFVLSWLIEWAVVSRIADDPRHGKVISVLAAWAVASMLYVLNGMHPTALIAYVIAAAIVGVIRYRAAVRSLARSGEMGDLEDTFR